MCCEFLHPHALSTNLPHYSDGCVNSHLILFSPLIKNLFLSCVSPFPTPLVAILTDQKYTPSSGLVHEKVVNPGSPDANVSIINVILAYAPNPPSASAPKK